MTRRHLRRRRPLGGSPRSSVAGGRSARRTQLITGLSSGLLQSTTIVLLQLVGPMSLSLGHPRAWLGWLVPVGLVIPVITSLVMALGDRYGGRRIVLVTAIGTFIGVTLVAVGGFAAQFGGSAMAIPVVIIGAVLTPTATRHGDLVVIHMTRAEPGERQLRAGTALRALLVVGVYGPVLPAGFVAQRYGWRWVFAAYTLLLIGCLVTLRTTVGADAGPPAPRDSTRVLFTQFVTLVRDGRLLWAAFGAMTARAFVFAFAAGLPVRLAGEGFPLVWRTAIGSAAIGASLLVAWRAPKTDRRFATVAGAVPVLAAGVLVVAGLLTSGKGHGAFSRSAIVTALAMGALASASILVEVTKQWNQLVSMRQARGGRTSARHARRKASASSTPTIGPAGDYARQAVPNLAGNLGAIAGTAVGPLFAAAGELRWTVLLVGLGACTFVLHASWYATPRRRDVGASNSSQC